MLELGIALPSGKPSGETRRQTPLIRALSDREQAASPPSPKRGRASRALVVASCRFVSAGCPLCKAGCSGNPHDPRRLSVGQVSAEPHSQPQLKDVVSHLLRPKITMEICPDRGWPRMRVVSP